MLLSQRERLLEAMVAAVADKGYAATTLTDVIRRAGVSRSTFYEHFRDKEDCFVVAYEEGARVHFDEILAAADTDDPFAQRVRAAVRRYLEVLAEQPAYARTFLVEVLAAGPSAAARREAVHERFVTLVVDWHKTLARSHKGIPNHPREVIEAATGGVNDLVAGWIRAGRTDELHRLEDPIVGFWLSVAGLPQEAAAAYRDQSPSANRRQARRTATGRRRTR